MGELLYSGEGRIGRGKFWLGNAWGLIVLAIGWGWVSLMQDAYDEPTWRIVYNMRPRSITALIFLVFVLVVVPLSLVWLKRLHDRGKSGWWALLLFVPVFGWTWLIVELGFLRAVREDNEWGLGGGRTRLEDRKGDRP